MEIRNVQKTGNMYYIYLPTSWCKKHNIQPKSHVTLSVESNGTLNIIPEKKEKKQSSIELTLSESDYDIINKLIVSCFINPTASFRINLENPVDIGKLLDQKKLTSVELVEFDGKTLSCESSIMLENPYALLKTMTRKVKNLLHIILNNYNAELVIRYEEEIDKSKMLIEKTVISSLAYSELSKERPIELYYISLISKNLENFVDHVRLISPKEAAFLKSLSDAVQVLLEILESTRVREEMAEARLKAVFTYIRLVKRINVKATGSKKDEEINKQIVKQKLGDICEVLLDWAITEEVLKKPKSAEENI